MGQEHALGSFAFHSRANTRLGCTIQSCLFRVGCLTRQRRAELPAIVRQELDVPNWERNLERITRQYKRSVIDKGGAGPLKALVLSFFAFNVLYSLPREMAHSRHAEEHRFHLKRH